MAFADFVIEIPEGRDPIVLQLTDTQIIDSAQCRTESRLWQQAKDFWATERMKERCFDYITEIVTALNPDLIIMTGDLVYGEFDDSGTTFTSFVSFMDSFRIPWAPIFGNHDNESAKGVDWQCDQFSNASYCLFDQKTLTGNGNYSVGIVQGGILKRIFYMLDSNACGGASAASRENGHTKRILGFAEDQIAWYTQSVQRVKQVYPDVKISFAYHVQQAVFADAFAQYGVTQSTEKPHIYIDFLPQKRDGDFGYIGAPLKSPWDKDRAVWNGMKALGVDSVFVGHEHLNSASIVYEGVRLQCGQKTSEYDRWLCVNEETGDFCGGYTKTGTSIIGGSIVVLSKVDGSIADAYIYYCENAGAKLDWRGLFEKRR